MKNAIVIVSGFAAAAALSASASAWASPSPSPSPSPSLSQSGPAQRAMAPVAPRGIAAQMPAATPMQGTADMLFYGRLGQGVSVAGGLHGGPVAGLGLRLELDRIGLDASMSFGLTRMGPNMEVTGMQGSWLKLTTQYFMLPNRDATPYLGAGLSWGGQKEKVAGVMYSGSGLQGEVVAGYEFLRSSTIRLFIQADATLPLYQAHGDRAVERRAACGKASVPGVAQRYLPMMGLSLGIAWGRPHVIGVQQVP